MLVLVGVFLVSLIPPLGVFFWFRETMRKEQPAEAEFMGKGEKTSNKGYSVIGFVLPWLMHGIYDFCLSEELAAVSNAFGYISLALAVASFVILIAMIVFMRKARNSGQYITPL